MTTTKRQPIAYNGSGSAIANYLKPQAEQEQKVENWGSFTSTKPNPQKRKVLFSLLHQAQWVKEIEGREVPDLDRLSSFLQSEKSPVKKKLFEMDIRELEKIIRAFKGIVQSTYK